MFLFTARDLVRMRTLKVMERRQASETCVVFRAQTTERSYQSGKPLRIVRQFAAIRRGRKWFLFRPWGFATRILRNHFKFPELGEPLMKLSRAEESHGQFAVEEYIIPLEQIHAGFVEQAKQKVWSDLQAQSEALRRFTSNLHHRVVRHDFATREEMEQALDVTQPFVRKLRDDFEQSAMTLYPQVDASE